jgi:hypothetical protein
MKRPISYYLNQGASDVTWGFKYISISQRLLLLAYGFIGFFGKLFFFSRPFFTLAESRLVTLMNQRKPFNIWQMFDQVVSREQYYRLMTSYFVMDVLTLFVGGVLALIPTLIWTFLTPSISSNEQLVGLYNVLFIYFIAFGIVALLFSFSFYRPFAYVAIHNPDLGSGSILTTTHQLLKKQNKNTIFLLNFVYFLFIFFLGLFITIQGTTVLFSSLLTSSGYRGFLPSLIFSIVFLVGLFLFTLWTFPASFVFLISTQHHLLIDSLQTDDNINYQPISTVTNSNEVLPNPPPVPSVELPTPKINVQTQSVSDKKITSKPKRKS